MSTQNNKTLLELIGKYLQKYLAEFARNPSGWQPKTVPSLCGIEIHPAQAMNFDVGLEYLDIEKLDFEMIHNHLPSATLKDFRHAVSTIDGIVLIEIGSWYGAEFGLWIASNDPSAEVHVYNPMHLDYFAPYLFNKLNPEKIFKLSELVNYNPHDQEGSINRLYKANGITNITFHLEAANKENLNYHARKNQHKRVIFFSDRTPTVPVEMTSVISSVVVANENAGMILMPLVNTDIDAYNDDDIIKLINLHWKIAKDQPSDIILDPSENIRTRLFTAINQYYSLKSAVTSNAKLYKESNPTWGFPFHQPTHYVSTVEIK